jgi:hypothetical protein
VAAELQELAVGLGPLDHVEPVEVYVMFSVRERRKKRGRPGTSASTWLRVLELRWVGWMTTKPSAARRLTIGP